MPQYEVDPDFQRKLDDFNRSQGGPVDVVVCWYPQKQRWAVYAVPYDYGTHPLGKTYLTPKLMREFKDGSGRRGVFLFTWESLTGEYLPLDDRLLQSLKYADTFRDKQHFEHTVKDPELQKEAQNNKEIRDIAYGAASYWYGLTQASSSSLALGNWRRARGLSD